MGRRSRPISPQLRRFVLDRDGAACTIAGCTSRYRLQVHHIKRWIDGGRTDPENLTTVCWFHHHVVIHGQGFRIDPDSPPQRRRLLQPPIHGPPWLEHARAKGMVITETPKTFVHHEWRRRGRTEVRSQRGGLERSKMRSAASRVSCSGLGAPSAAGLLSGRPRSDLILVVRAPRTAPLPPSLRSATLPHFVVEGKTRAQSRVSCLCSLLFAFCPVLCYELLATRSPKRREQRRPRPLGLER